MKKILYFIFLLLLTITLIACNKKETEKTYIVTFDTNGGNPAFLEPENVVSDNKVTEPLVTKEGYQLKHWLLFNSNKIWEFDEDSVVEDITLVAVWQETTSSNNNYYTITFDSDGGSLINEQEVLAGEKVLKPENPTKENYLFYTWELNGIPFDFDQAINSDITLVAIWVLEDVSTEVITKEVIASYSGSSTTNFSTNENLNQASLIDLDSNVFTVLGTTNGDLGIGLNASGQIRLYSNADNGSGNKLTIKTEDENIITKIEIEFLEGRSNPQSANLKLDNQNISLTTNQIKNNNYQLTNLSITEFSIQNTHAGKNSSQIWIKEIKITYQNSSDENNGLTNEQKVLNAKNSLTTTSLLNNNEFADAIKTSLLLPTEFEGVNIIWSSSNNNVINNKGIIGKVLENSEVILTATFKLGLAEESKSFTFIVVANDLPLTDQEKLVNALNNLIVNLLLGNNQNATNITSNLTLPTILDEVNITWSSNNNAINNKGLVTRSEDNDINVTLIATLKINNLEETKSFSFTVLKQTNSNNPSDNDPVIVSYYNAVKGQSGNSLFMGLRTIISNQKTTSYDQAKTILEIADRDPNNSKNVLLIYNRASVTGKWNSSILQWNREHVWPQSLLKGAPKGEIHNLRAADKDVNSSRGNLAFANGSGTYKKISGGWYPGDEDKGDVARIMFYMITRYSQLDIKTMGSLQMFMNWHLEDPVDDFERNRNNVLYSYTNNRNPYIDYPEFIEQIYGNVNVNSQSEYEMLLNYLNNDLVDKLILKIEYVNLNDEKRLEA